jgi:hydrogenase maturation protein HypF
MASFRMCPSCQAEYDNPASRRFHAQPNACSACGPHVWFLDRERQEVAGDPISIAARWLADGAVLAIKGIGGFHLACMADDDRAVATMRLRKQRDAKPFALMVSTLDLAREFASIDQAAEQALRSAARPIVLVPKRHPNSISDRVAPGASCFGIMLPYTPIQHLLFLQGLGPLVMTSANLSEEPLCYENEEALERLAHIADGFLMHNRPIERRVDDSILLSTALEATPIVPIRRSRGYVPEPIRLSRPAPEPILALGGDLKSTLCIASGQQAVLSEHFGDLANPDAYRSYLGGIPRLAGLLRVAPVIVAHDLHPDYHSTRYAQWEARQRLGIQHHHAHIASCMAEHGVSDRVVGIACDGTGYGTDGSIWGCEILVCDEMEFQRAAHLRYFRLPGGDAAAAEIWRPAVSLLRETFGRDWREAIPDSIRRRLPAASNLIDQRLTTARDIPLTSSLGRLFDAVAWMLNVCSRNRYEGEAAMALEAVASTCSTADPLCFDWHDEPGRPMQLDVRVMIQQLVEQISVGEAMFSVAQMARAFHEGIAMMLVAAATGVAAREGIPHVALSGGCFVNRILLDRVSSGLRAAGYGVLMHQRVPPGDGGLALGQAVVAAARLRRG